MAKKDAIYLGNTEVKVNVATLSKDLEKGLSGKKRLKDGTGWMMAFLEETMNTVVMDKMLFSIDVVFLDKDWNIVYVKTLKPGRSTATFKSKYVLELPENYTKDNKISFMSKVQPSEELLNTIDEKLAEKDSTAGEDPTYEVKEGSLPIDPETCHVLNSDGENIMNYTGIGERLFSRKHTKKIAELSKKIKDNPKDDKSRRDLGILMVEIIHLHNTQEEETVAV